MGNVLVISQNKVALTLKLNEYCKIPCKINYTYNYKIIVDIILYFHCFGVGSFSDGNILN